MRSLRLPRFDLSDAAFKFTGLALAGGSIVFASEMISGSRNTPRITGMEHLAIYARPANHASSLERQVSHPAVDFTPTGSITKIARGALLTAYEILDATKEGALVRLPEGRVTRVSKGNRLAGLGRVLSLHLEGRKWVLVTEGGIIRER